MIYSDLKFDHLYDNSGQIAMENASTTGNLVGSGPRTNWANFVWKHDINRQTLQAYHDGNFVVEGLVPCTMRVF